MLPYLLISSLSPSSAKRGATITVIATGLDEGSTGTFTDAEETVHNLTLTATETGYAFTVPEDAAFGAGVVTITNGDGQSDTAVVRVLEKIPSTSYRARVATKVGF